MVENIKFGIYEKALPNVIIEEKINIAKSLNFDFIEMSIDESEARLDRLNWDDKQILKINKICENKKIEIRSICFSGQRKFPLGSHDESIRKKSLKLLEKCIILAHKLGVRIIQLAGYDVFYEEKDSETNDYFIKNLNVGLAIANKYGVMLAIETMDDPYICNITKYLKIKEQCNSPWLSVYPDLGNLSAWEKTEKVINELDKGWHEIVGLHIKDTEAVTKTHKGKFKNVDFGKGCVEFEKIFRHLKLKNYTGSMLIEGWYEEFDHSIERLKEAMDFVLKKMMTAGWKIVI